MVNGAAGKGDRYRSVNFNKSEKTYAGWQKVCTTPDAEGNICPYYSKGREFCTLKPEIRCDRHERVK